MPNQQVVTNIVNKDAWEAIEILAKLVQRHWPDTLAALRMARSFRALRTIREELEQIRESLIKRFSSGEGEQTKLTDPMGFTTEWRKVMNDSSQVTMHPVSSDVLSTPSCEQCKLSTPVLTAQEFEILVYTGVIIEA